MCCRIRLRKSVSRSNAILLASAAGGNGVRSGRGLLCSVHVVVYTSVNFRNRNGHSRPTLVATAAEKQLSRFAWTICSRSRGLQHLQLGQLHIWLAPEPSGPTRGDGLLEAGVTAVCEPFDWPWMDHRVSKPWQDVAGL